MSGFLLVCDAPAAITPTKADILDVKANFISMRDSWNRVMLSWFWPLLPEYQQQDWFSLWRSSGLTHVVMCPVMSYPHNALGPEGSDLLDDWRGQPERFATVVTRALQEGFIPIIQMTSGDGGTGHDVDVYWPALIAALSNVKKFCLGSCGFETAGGGWRSAQTSRGVTMLHNSGFGAIMLHCQPERATGASYHGEGPQSNTPPDCIWIDYHDPTRPGIGAFIENDDPWRGDEAGFWTSHGGEFIDMLWYQTPHGSKLLDPNGGGPNIGAWEDRWIEIIERLGVGGRGWRQVNLCMGEKTGYDYFHNACTDADVVRTSNRAYDLCVARSVVCGFGDGLPD